MNSPLPFFLTNTLRFFLGWWTLFPLIVINAYIHMSKALALYEVLLSVAIPYFWADTVQFEKSFPIPVSYRALCMFPSRGFNILYFTMKTLILLYLIFMQDYTYTYIHIYIYTDRQIHLHRHTHAISFFYMFSCNLSSIVF